MTVYQISSRRRSGIFAIIAVAAMVAVCPAFAQDKPGPDVIVFTNGDQLTGKFEKSVGTSITFKSDALGEITVPMEKIKEMKSPSNFVVLKKDEKITREAPKVASPITIADGVVKEDAGAQQTIDEKNVAFVIDGATYEKELHSNPGFFRGWNGSLTGGVTVLQATSYGQTFTAGISLIRAIPSVAYLPLRTRTTFNLIQTYGKLTQPQVPLPPACNGSTVPLGCQDAVAKTNIFHTDFEHDKFLTSRFYMLGGVAFDHNFAQGLDLQQLYGVGAGYTILLDPVQQLDAKTDIHYMRQNFIQLPPPQISSPNQDLIGSTFGESYKRILPGKVLLTQSATYIQSWNNTEAWQAIGAFGLTLPVYHRFSLNTSFLNTYLNNPAFGFKKNSLQFITGVTYTLH